MHGNRECLPGEPAPAAGEYKQIRVLGSPTGVRVVMREGQPLPAAPIGFTWVLEENPVVSPPTASQGQPTQLTASQLRAEAAGYRQLAAQAQTATARNELAALAARLAALAARLEARDGVEPADQANEPTGAGPT